MEREPQPNRMSGYSPPFQGGVAARSRKYRAATSERAAGVVEKFHKIQCASRFVPNHPVRSYQRWLRDIRLRSRPPLLGKEGNSARPKNLAQKTRSDGFVPVPPAPITAFQV